LLLRIYSSGRTESKQPNSATIQFFFLIHET
jgi:hypothetical protein